MDTEVEELEYTDFEIEMYIQQEIKEARKNESRLDQAYWILLEHNLIPAGHKDKVMPTLYRLYE